MNLENQRYGRNKNTVVNHQYIASAEYRRKFDKITDNKELRRILYSAAKEMLTHRSGTLFEDMYWIDERNGNVIASALNEQQESGISYSKAIYNSIKDNKHIITMHTHPNSSPPSISDFNSAFVHKYRKSLVICHNGAIYAYISNCEVSIRLYDAYVAFFSKAGYNDIEAQLKALLKLKSNYDIDFWEVT